MRKVSLQVEKMSCGNCLHTIETALEKLEGVVLAKASLEDKTVAVEYDETKVKETRLVGAIEEAGYLVI